MANKIVTPDMSHMQVTDSNIVYEPAEDSFLLLDALEKDLHFIHLKKPKIVLEIGSGSGVIITALSTVLKSSAHCLAIEINPHACLLTKATAQHNHSAVDVIRGDLTSCLKNFSVDMIVFNPPYVVTPNSEVYSNDYLTRSWAGGIDGREVIDKFLKSFTEVINEKCFGYLLLLKENHPCEVIELLKKSDFMCEIIAKRKLRGEELFVVKFKRKEINM